MIMLEDMNKHSVNPADAKDCQCPQKHPYEKPTLNTVDLSLEALTLSSNTPKQPYNNDSGSYSNGFGSNCKSKGGQPF